MKTMKHMTCHITATVAVIIALTLACMPLSRAYAYEQADIDALQAQADSIFSTIDALQNDLNQANAEYDSAVYEHNEATKAKNAAEVRIKEAEEKIADLQVKLSDMASNMYKSGGNASFLNVILGSASFNEFMSGWDMLSRVSDQNADLVQEAKDVRAEAQAAQAEYEMQSQRAEEKMQLAKDKQLQIAEKQSQLSAQAAQISGEIADIEAQMELEAEAARAAEEAAKAAAEAYAATLHAGASVNLGSGFFANPCPAATQSSGWGYREFDNSFHKGTDMAAPTGTPFYAAEAGTVIYATNDGGYNGGAGNWVVISHGNGLVTKYMHASAVFVKVGDSVERGQNIGAVGNTGNSFGSHLHFQVEINGVAVCPYDFL